jgi:hypothetical protein
MRKIRLQVGKEFLFSLDVESDGLYGKPIAIGAVVYDDEGDEVDRFILKRDVHVYEPWVIEHVMPQLEDVEAVSAYYTLLSKFTEFYNKYRVKSMFIVHMGVPVEATLFREMHINNLLHEFDGPYPLFDISSDLLAAYADPTSPDKYIEDHGIDIEFAGGTHNPLYDAIVAAKVYMHLNEIIL